MRKLKWFSLRLQFVKFESLLIFCFDDEMILFLSFLTLNSFFLNVELLSSIEAQTEHSLTVNATLSHLKNDAFSFSNFVSNLSKGTKSNLQLCFRPYCIDNFRHCMLNIIEQKSSFEHFQCIFMQSLKYV